MPSRMKGCRKRQKDLFSRWDRRSRQAQQRSASREATVEKCQRREGHATCFFLTLGACTWGRAAEACQELGQPQPHRIPIPIDALQHPAHTIDQCCMVPSGGRPCHKRVEHACMKVHLPASGPCPLMRCNIQHIQLISVVWYHESTSQHQALRDRFSGKLQAWPGHRSSCLQVFVQSPVRLAAADSYCWRLPPFLGPVDAEMRIAPMSCTKVRWYKRRW